MALIISLCCMPFPADSWAAADIPGGYNYKISFWAVVSISLREYGLIAFINKIGKICY